MRLPLLPILALAAAAGAPRADAQRADARRPPADSAASRPAIVGRRDLATFGAFVAAGAALFPVDVRLTRAIRRPGVQRDRVARDAARAFNAAGDPGALVASLATFGVGRLAGSPATARLGLHATEAVVLGGTTTAVLKLLAGRQRPYVDERDADDFVPGRGFGEGRASFPSGHVTVAFALASSVAADLRPAHPRAARIAAPLLYGGATLVGGARMFDAKHWASDVAIGAGVGTLAGRAVVGYARAHPHGALERLAGRVAVAPAPVGGALGISATLRTR